MGQCTRFFFWRFYAFFKIFQARLGKNSKNVSFYKGVCMCKAKLTFVSFFFEFFF